MPLTKVNLRHKILKSLKKIIYNSLYYFKKWVNHWHFFKNDQITAFSLVNEDIVPYFGSHLTKGASYNY